MFGSRRMVVLIAVLAALFAVGCSKFQSLKVRGVAVRLPKPGAQVVDKVKATKDRISLKEERDFAFWASEKNTTLSVTFDRNDNPFESPQPVCTENRCYAGPPRANTARDKPYKYTICVNATECKDPEVMIKN